MSDIIFDMPAVEYHAIDAWSASRLKRFRHCPAAALVPQADDTGALAFGTATHSLILEGRKTHVVAPACDKRTKEGKAIWQEFQDANAGLLILSADDDRLITEMGQAVHCHPAACDLLAQQGHVEASLFWLDEFSGLNCKARPDLFLPERGMIVDLKTCTDAGEHGFGQAVNKYGYALQAAMYLEAVQTVTQVAVDRFIFIAIEKAPPFRVGIYELDADYLAYGRKLMFDALSDVYKCIECNNWPNYLTDTIITLPKPAWCE